ncbi:MAG: hypothetical protein IPM16_21420 [Chloroflexi bacterium]|nr:hypothetical protein [Chloroflexota bacterium]
MLGEHRAIRAVLYLILLTTPIAVTMAMLAIVHGASLTDLMPAGPDDVFYWRQAAVFARAGFNGGYMTAAEELSALPFARFFAWGLATPLVYGAAATIAWPYYGVPLVNLALLTGSLAVLITIVRPRIPQTLMLIVVFGAFPSTLIHAPTSMQELFQHALAVMAATAFVYLIRRRQDTPWPARAAIAILIMAMSITKVTWAILWIPYFVLLSRKVLVRTVAAALFASMSLAILAAVIHRLTAAPYPFAAASSDGLTGTFEAVLGGIRENLGLFNSGHPLEVFTRLLVIAGAAVALVSVFRRWRAGLDERNTALLVAAGTVSVTLVAGIVLYQIKYFRDFRLITSPLLMALTLLIVMLPLRWGIAMVGVQAIALIWAIPYYAENSALHVSSRVDRQVAKWTPLLSEAFPYDPARPSPWCNTALVSPYYIFDNVGVSIALDNGIGLSLLTLERGIAFPVKSAYLLLDEALYAHIGYQLRVEAVFDIPGGKLYRNLDSGCF